MGLSPDNVAKSITDVTSSSRFTNKNLWLDTKNAYTYQTQVEVPEYNMNSIEQLQSVPVGKRTDATRIIRYCGHYNR